MQDSMMILAKITFLEYQKSFLKLVRILNNPID